MDTTIVRLLQLFLQGHGNNTQPSLKQLLWHLLAANWPPWKCITKTATHKPSMKFMTISINDD